MYCPSNDYITAGKTKVHSVWLQCDNVEFVHECCPQHLRMRAAKMKEWTWRKNVSREKWIW